MKHQQIKLISINPVDISCLLDYWLDKVEDCYKNEVKISMKEFRKEHGLPEFIIRDYSN